MKDRPMKTSILALLTIITAAALATPDPESKPDPVDAAKLAVQTQIVARLHPEFPGAGKYPRFSRAGTPEYPSPKYEAPLLVDGEKRLPFTFKTFQFPKGTTVNLTGYVRLSDQQIFLLDPSTKMYRVAHKDPRFAKHPSLAESSGDGR